MGELRPRPAFIRPRRDGLRANIAKLPDIFEMIQMYAARLYAARRFDNERGGIASGSPVRGENPP
jgi:hypothetical protein